MSDQNFKIEGMTIAIINMDEMLKFYSEIFEINFIPHPISDQTLYAGKWAEWNVLFCPAELAGNTATQNRHQFDIEVSDIDSFLDKVVLAGGSIMADKQEQDNMISASIYDPDNNSIVFKKYID